MAASVICKIKHEAKLSALLVLMQHAKCFTLSIARAKPCLTVLKNLHMNT